MRSEFGGEQQYSEGAKESISEIPVTEEEIRILWGEYGFYGRPPRVDTSIMRRLYDVCKGYVDVILEEEIKPKTEVGFKKYEPERRRLHDIICDLVLGQSRESLSESVAESISDFASRLVYKMHLNDLIESFLEVEFSEK